MGVRLGRVAVTAWLASACYHPSAQVGLPCSPNHTCPGEQVCDLAQSPPICVDELVDAGGSTDGHPAGCAADLECDGACHELTGACVAEATILYVSAAGNDNTACSKAAPCASVAAALARATATRAFVRVDDGTYVGGWNVRPLPGGLPNVIISGPDVDPAGVVFSPTAADDLETQSTTSLVLEGVTIQGAPAAGLVVRGTVTVSHVVVASASSAGLEVRSAGTLTVRDSRIASSGGLGISSLGLVDVQRAQILNNQGGGISASGGYTIVNTILANNGSPLSGLIGGARLSPSAGKPAVFRFNTVTKNSAPAQAAGVQCDGPVVIEDSIIANNGLIFASEIGSSCAPSFCLLAMAATNGNNVEGDPRFVNAASDFHLMAGSPAIDKADPDATEALDFEGGARPSGPVRDIGADERP